MLIILLVGVILSKTNKILLPFFFSDGLLIGWSTCSHHQASEAYRRRPLYVHCWKCARSSYRISLPRGQSSRQSSQLQLFYYQRPLPFGTPCRTKPTFLDSWLQTKAKGPPSSGGHLNKKQLLPIQVTTQCSAIMK